MLEMFLSGNSQMQAAQVDFLPGRATFSLVGWQLYLPGVVIQFCFGTLLTGSVILFTRPLNSLWIYIWHIMA